MVEFLRNFITVNTIIIQFVYGLAFFVLGLAIALQSRHSSHLDLARSLTWLAAFGFVHAFVEWGDLFIPLQTAYLSPDIITALQYFHLLILGISFACLFEFGVALLEPLEHPAWLHITSAALLATWFFVTFFPLRSWIQDFQSWYNSGNALARYFIGLPGGLLSAYALRKHIYQRILPLNVPHIVRSLRTAGISLAVYALATGLIVPPVNFFPGNWLNSDTFSQVFIITPPILRALIGLVIVISTIRALEIFDVETARQIEAIEEQQILADERERIGRELHDGAIQKVYTAGLLIRSAQKLAMAESPLEGRLATAVGVLDDAIVDLRQNLGELHASKPNTASLEQGLRDLAADPRFGSLVKIELDLDLPSSEEFSPEQSSHILAIVQEALANSVRHAHARHIRIHARQVDRRLMLGIQDDGAGIPPQVAEGHGLHNMHDRAALLHGRLEVRPMEKGTSVILDIPWEARA
ncbi:MAG: ATP-binding protein [Anaerolineales bacterium]|jgi:signal transduction histidine kinase